MKESTIIDLIRTSEMVNDRATVLFMNRLNRNIGISQIIVLSKLHEHGPQMSSKLASMLGYTTGAMTGISNKLIRENYAKREYLENDRRVILLTITDEGREIINEVQELNQKMMAEIYSKLSEEEITQYLNIQKKLLDHVEDEK